MVEEIYEVYCAYCGERLTKGEVADQLGFVRYDQMLCELCDSVGPEPVEVWEEEEED